MLEWRAGCLTNLGTLNRDQGDWERAESLFRESLDLYRELHQGSLGLAFGNNVAEVLGLLGSVEWHRREYARAAALWRESLTLCRNIMPTAEKIHFAHRLSELGGVMEIQGCPKQAARLLGAACRIFDDLGTYGGVRIELDGIRAALGEQEYAAAWAEGRAMLLEEAIRFALAEDVET
jgi:tetratricopeptide (TPR) repeat protein